MIRATRKILLVDDHLDTINAMARLLHLTGFEVKTATTYADALSLCDNDAKYDLLISDVGLPDGTGYDLMRTVLHRNCASHGIAVSGYGAETDVQQSLEAGFSAHLVKPVEFETLRSAIQRLIPS